MVTGGYRGYRKVQGLQESTRVTRGYKSYKRVQGLQ
jgi:hypothetical protein